MVLRIDGGYIGTMGRVFGRCVAASGVKKSYLGIMPAILSRDLAIVLAGKRGFLRSIARRGLAGARGLALAWLDRSCCILLLLFCGCLYWTRCFATTVLTGKQWITNKIKA